jgi:nicotinamidase-related amidase
MTRKRKGVSDSPLIDPAVSCLILIAPKEDDLIRVSPRAEADVQRKLRALADAADIMDVPAFLVSPGPSRRIDSLAAHVPRLPSHHQFLTGEGEVPWCNSTLVEMLDRTNNSVLVVAGFWMEHEILTTALHARHDTYYVYVPVDAAPARSEIEAALARERLMQAGATPVVTSQVLREWCLEAPDTTKQAALASLLAPIV